MVAIVFSYDVEVDGELESKAYGGEEPHVVDQRSYDEGNVDIHDLVAWDAGTAFVRLMPAPDGWSPANEQARRPLEFIPGWDPQEAYDESVNDGVDIFDRRTRIIAALIRNWE
jgi:hypothetical protein